MARFLTFAAIIFAMIAAYFIYAAFSLETTIVTHEAPAGFEGVANMQLMHHQTLLTLVGIGSAIVSAVLLAGGEICTRLDPPDTTGD